MSCMPCRIRNQRYCLRAHGCVPRWAPNTHRTGLERDPTGVKRDALADKGQGLSVLVRRALVVTVEELCQLRKRRGGEGGRG